MREFNDNLGKSVSIFLHKDDKTIFCGYSFESPRQGHSNEYPRFYGELKKMTRHHQIPTLSISLSILL